jgi:hypothetical protein
MQSVFPRFSLGSFWGSFESGLLYSHGAEGSGLHAFSQRAI